MLANTCQVINFVFYGETSDAARALVGSIIGGDEQKSVWIKQADGYELRGYIRWPKCTPTASPIGSTDCLVVETSIASEHLESIKSYIGNRRSIPFKVVVSNDDMTEWAKGLDLEYVPSSLLDSLQAKLFSSAKTLEESLRGVFNKIDTNGNGFVEKSEISNLSKELGHELSQSEVEEIAHTLAEENGQISFSKFKSWWIMGRSNFIEFRKLVELEMTLGKFLKKGSTHFNSYLEDLQKELQENAASDVSYRGKFSLAPKEDFTSGIRLSFHLACGNDFELIKGSLPDYSSHSPFFYSLEFSIKDPEQGSNIVAKLNELKEMFGEMIPQLKQFLQMGAEIHFRNVANSVFIDLTFCGIIAQQMEQNANMWKSLNAFITGHSNFHITSGWNPLNFINGTLDENISNASNLKIEGNGEFLQLKTFILALSNSLSKSFESNSHASERAKYVIFVLKLLSCLRKYDFDIKYSAKDLHDLIKDIFPNKESDFWGNRFIKEQTKIPAMIEQGKGMKMFVTDYLDIIKAIDFDTYSMNFAMNDSKVFYKVTLHLPGVTAFLNEHFLN